MTLFATRGAPERVRHLRSALMCSLFEARRKADKEAVQLAIEQAASIDDLKPVLHRLAELIEPGH